MSSPSKPEESTGDDANETGVGSDDGPDRLGTDETGVGNDDAVDHLDAVDAAEVSDAEGSDDEADQWRFGVDDVGEEGAVRDPLEPESISAENALFVVVGVLLTLGIVLVAVL